MKENRLSCDMQRLHRDVLLFCLSRFTKRSALKLTPKNTFRLPTKKEQAKHSKLIERQRRRS